MLQIEKEHKRSTLMSSKQKDLVPDSYSPQSTKNAETLGAATPREFK
jgi:hypothetical protein